MSLREYNLRYGKRLNWKEISHVVPTPKKPNTKKPPVPSSGVGVRNRKDSDSDQVGGEKRKKDSSGVSKKSKGKLVQGD